MKKFIFIFLLAISGSGSCSYLSNPNQMDSDNYGTKEERVAILKKEIKPFSDFKNAEFELFNVNGFSNSRTTLPGASSWDYKFVVKVAASEVDKWINGAIRVEPKDYDDFWMKKIIQERENDWKTDSEPEFYTRKEANVMIVVYRLEGIVFKRVITD